MALRWQLDDREFPIVVLRVVGEDDGELPDLKTGITAVEALFARKKPCLLVHDFRYTRPNAERRRQIKDWIASVPPEKRKLIKAYAVVAHSAAQRGVLTAVLWFIARPLMPIQVFSDEASAIAWVRSLVPIHPDKPARSS